MLKLRDIMARDVITVSPDLSLREAMALFASRHISGAPVVAAGKVLGVLSTTDLLDFSSSLEGSPTYEGSVEASESWEEAPEWQEGVDQIPEYFTEMWEDAGADLVERFNTPDSPEWNVLDAHVVSEAMTAMVNSLPPDTPLTKAADYLRRHDIHRVLVMQDGRLEGIVTTSDVVDAVAEGRAGTDTTPDARAKQSSEKDRGAGANDRKPAP
jgi:CBS domain-containing protein